VIAGGVEAIVGHYGTLLNSHIFLPGSIRPGKCVFISIFAHSVLRGDEPCGFGQLHAEGDAIVFTGRYDLHDPRGRFGFTMVERLGAKARWSMCFTPVAWELRARAHYAPGQAGLVQVVRHALPFEISPVIRGADRQTRTLRCGAYVAADLAASLTQDKIGAGA
jgi:hypothetical protein